MKFFLIASLVVAVLGSSIPLSLAANAKFMAAVNRDVVEPEHHAYQNGKSNFYRVETTGIMKRIGSADFDPIGLSSALSPDQKEMLFFGWNKTHHYSLLLGFNVHTGNLTRQVRSPFYQCDGVAICAAEAVSVDNAGNVFVVGQETKMGPMVGGFLNMKTGELEHKVVLNSNTVYLPRAVIEYIPSKDKFIVALIPFSKRYNRYPEIFAVDMKASSVKQIPNKLFENIYSLNYDPNEERVLAVTAWDAYTFPELNHNLTMSSLDLDSNKFSTVSVLQKYKHAFQSRNFGPGALDTEGGFLYWVSGEAKLWGVELSSLNSIIRGPMHDITALQFITA